MASAAKPVFTLALTDPVWVRVYLPETRLGRVPVGARATVGTDSHPGKNLRAWVGYVSPSAEFTPKSVETTEIRASLVYQARVFVCEGKEALRLGMPATVTIKLDQAAPAAGADPCKWSECALLPPFLKGGWGGFDPRDCSGTAQKSPLTPLSKGGESLAEEACHG
jgi:hypothetical protein